MEHRKSVMSPLPSAVTNNFMLNALGTILIAFFIGTAHAENFTFSFTDPVRDHSGTVDVVSMVFNFDNTNGAYEIILAADEANPFIGDFRVNINLFNPDTGFAEDKLSDFGDTLNEYSLAVATTTITLTGNHTSLLVWEAGDRVAASGPEPLGLPSGVSFFRSAVGNIPSGGFMKDEDTIAFGNIATIKSSHIKPVGVLDSDVVYSQRITDRKSIYTAAELADNFILGIGATITEIRFWGGYGIYDVPQQDYFTIHFYNDTRSGKPEVSPFASFSQLTGTRTPTQYLTWPGDTVYEYELQLPRPVNVQARKKYYLAFEISDLPGTTVSSWAWSGASVGDHWSRGDGDSYLNISPYPSFDLAFELKASPVLIDSGNPNDTNTLSFDAETILNWAEENYPQFFPPPGATTQFFDPWLYRYYPTTNIYAGVNTNNEVWVLGDVFGGLVYVSTVEELLASITPIPPPIDGGNDTPDITGTWRMTEQEDGRSCGDGVYTYRWTATLVVNGNQVAMTTRGVTISGVLNGNTATFSNFSYPEDWGITTSTGTLTINGNTLSGDFNWSWTDGYYSCSGTSTIVGEKIE